MKTVATYKGINIIESPKMTGWFVTEDDSICGQSIDEVIFDIDFDLIQKAKEDKVTVYYKGDFGMAIQKIEGRLSEIGTKRFAQYLNAPYIKIIPKRKCKDIQLIQSFNPYMLVLSGVGHPEIDNGMVQVSEIVSRSKHNGFSPNWITEADELLNSYLSTKPETIVLGDYRSSNGFKIKTKQYK